MDVTVNSILCHYPGETGLETYWFILCALKFRWPLSSKGHLKAVTIFMCQGPTHIKAVYKMPPKVLSSVIFDQKSDMGIDCSRLFNYHQNMITDWTNTNLLPKFHENLFITFENMHTQKYKNNSLLASHYHNGIIIQTGERTCAS